MSQYTPTPPRDPYDTIDLQEAIDAQACAACGAERGEPCRPGCLGLAALMDEAGDDDE
jgi:hypothetical protein